MTIVGIIISVIVGTIALIFWFSTYVAKKYGLNPGDQHSQLKNKFRPTDYGYVVDQEDLDKKVKEVFDSYSKTQRKQLKNVRIMTSGENRIDKFINGDKKVMFGEYRSAILLYPNNLFPHNKNKMEFMEHFESLIRHEIAHHFGMTEEEILKNQKRLKITK